MTFNEFNLVLRDLNYIENFEAFLAQWKSVDKAVRTAQLKLGKEKENK